MSLFALAVALLLVLAIAVIAIPLRRARSLTSTTMVTAVAVPLLAIGLFFLISDGPPGSVSREGLATPDSNQLLEVLGNRVRENPEDVTAWEFLGRTYFTLGQYESAASAYAEAWRRTEDPGNPLKLAYAESQLLSQRDAVTGFAGQLIEQILADEPDNARALMYGGLAAEIRGQPELARERWHRLIQQQPPEPIANVVRERLAALDNVPNSGPDEPKADVR
jgi:cytochrome c-type biogenesis protein CcmH